MMGNRTRVNLGMLSRNPVELKRTHWAKTNIPKDLRCQKKRKSPAMRAPMANMDSDTEIIMTVFGERHVADVIRSQMPTHGKAKLLNQISLWITIK
jgi:hypothetical protein